MPIIKHHIDKFLEARGDVPILDVRSPSEYALGHIAKARSFPLFTDEERAQIGTMYKQVGKREAIKKGLEIVGPKMAQMVEEAESLSTDRLAVYCWRGGMRSDSVAWLLDRCGFDVDLLEGGYKSYRKALIGFFEQKLPLKVLTGYTGSKKTHLLELLRKKGEQVIDIEGLANHQGSSFGNKKSDGQPTTEQFQNALYDEFIKMDLQKTIWVEDESMNIGQVFMPEVLYKQKNASPHVFLEIPKAQRIGFLVEDYGSLTSDQLVAATQSISRKLGKPQAEEAIKLINDSELGAAADIILTYYDKRYHKSIMAKKQYVCKHIKADLSDLESIAEELATK